MLANSPDDKASRDFDSADQKRLEAGKETDLRKHMDLHGEASRLERQARATLDNAPGGINHKTRIPPLVGMHKFTDSIRASIASENWYAALSLALTLPDICGRLDNPAPAGSARYAAWFETWMAHHYKMHAGFKGYEHVFLCGEDCYALRCSFLHQGEANIDRQRARRLLSDFHFITPPPGGGQVHCNQVNDTLQLQVDVFSTQMADAVDQWADSVHGNADTQSRIDTLLTIHDSRYGVWF